MDKSRGTTLAEIFTGAALALFGYAALLVLGLFLLNLGLTFSWLQRHGETHATWAFVFSVLLVFIADSGFMRWLDGPWPSNQLSPAEEDALRNRVRRHIGMD